MCTDPYIESEVGYLRIPLKDIVIATNNFTEENFIKRGRSADVYKGLLLQSEASINVVIWRFHLLSWHQEMYFLVEIQRLSRLNHRNVASCIGFCDENDERMIVMEHVVNGSLDKYLSDPNLTWSQRLRICYGVTVALVYINDHRDIYFGIKCSKILLDKEWEAKICCIRISLHKETGYTTCESDMYSLGWILFEVLSGKKATINDVNQYLACNHYEQVDDIIVPYLKKQMHTQSLSIFSEIAYNCLKEQHVKDDLEQIAERLREALALQWNHENHVKNLAYLKIPLSDIKLAAYDFAVTCCIKSHGDDMVYVAELDRKHELPKKAVVIKRINKDRYWKTTDFYAELELLAGCKHHNLVSLLGFCDEDSGMILVFERPFIGTLDDYLGSTSNKTNLTWEQRIRICLDIAHGLKYLHNMELKQGQCMIHQGILSANVTLDEKWTAKIANFRLSEFNSCSTSLWLSSLKNFSTWVPKANDALAPWIPPVRRLVVDDIYSLGVILFEVLTGRLAYDPFYMADNFNGFASMARLHFNARTIKNIIDPSIMEDAQKCSYTLKTGPNQYSLDTYSKIAYQCLAESPSQRPTLEAVIKSLEKALHFQVQNFEHLKIQLKDILSATNNFDKTCCIGSGGYGEVYKAELKTKSKNELCETLNTVAIKRIFSREDNQGKEGFLAELDVLTRCEHPNIVSLLGFCVEGGERILVYEHAANGSLNDYLGSTDNLVNLTWAQCLKMCIDIAKGLNYLHTNMEEKRMVIHRDIKSDNILLGKNWEAKIADFGLSKFHPANQEASTINTMHIAGTHKYVDPEYAKTGQLKRASDVYSFGVVLFEIFFGKLANDSSFITKNEKGLAPMAQIHFEMGTLNEMLDPKLMKNTYELGFTKKVGPDHDSLDAFSRIAYKCLAKTQAERPTIDVVIKELEKALYIQENAMKTLKISLEHIKLSVENFSEDNFTMRGGYGRLDKGKVQYDNIHKEVVVKRFNAFSQKDVFLKEFEVLYKYEHENIISLVGYCKEIDEKIIVYEKVSGTLDRYLNDTSFSWIKRLKICIDIANGLNFLHGGSVGQFVVIHRDLKSSNILLTENWKAKICGFELALTYPANEEIEFLKNDVVGSPGYCDPLYSKTHYLTKESDIYSFGVILFEILCGRLACPEDGKYNIPFIDDLVKSHFQVARVDDIVFEAIKEQIVLKSFVTFRRIAFQCLHEEKEERPTAGDVVVQLQKALDFQEAYEIRVAKLHSTYKEILHQISKSPDTYSTMRKRDIYNILSKGILLEDDKRITQLQESVRFIQHDDEDYHSEHETSTTIRRSYSRRRHKRRMLRTTTTHERYQ